MGGTTTRRRAQAVLLFVCGMIGLVAGLTHARSVSFVVHSSEDRVGLYEQFFAAFTEQSGIQVDFVQAPPSQVDKWELVITRMAGGVSPDVVGAVSVEFVQYAASGLLQPLDPYMAGDGEVQNLIPTLVGALQWQGGQYVFPYGASGVVMVGNRNLFNEAGLPPPPAEWGVTDWAWERFVDTAQRLTVRRGNGEVEQFGLHGPYWDNWMTLPYNWGGDWIDADLRRFTGTSAGAVASLEALRRLRWDEHVMPQPGEPGGGIDGLIGETAVMGGIGTWYLPRVLAGGDTFQLMPWFRVEDHPLRGPIHPAGLTMLSTAPNPAEAWAFIRFATLDPGGNFLYARAAGALPAYIGEPHRRWVEEIQAQAPSLNPMAFVDQVATYGAILNIRKVTTFDEIHRVMEPAVQSVYNNDVSARQAMEEAAPAVQSLIDASGH